MKGKGKWVLKKRLSPDVFENLLCLRNLNSPLEIENFLAPPQPSFFMTEHRLAGLENDSLNKASRLIKESIADGRTIIIHGDYDVDGICATAILWKTIYQGLGYKKCLPFIPNRFDHGYGLSRESVDTILSSQLTAATAGSRSGGTTHPDVKSGSRPKHRDNSQLLVTVDCGITAATAVEYAKGKGFEILVVDHHSQPERIPDCQILWSDKLCAAGLAYFLSEHLLPQGHFGGPDLVALATIADLQPLTGPNRSLVKYGLAALNQTQNLGLRTLIKAAGIENRKLGTFEVGWVLAPRLNASGRLENGLQSLRLLCTNDPAQALLIASDLNKSNAERQEMTKQALELAGRLIGEFNNLREKVKVAIHENFHEGIIGLVAGRLVQEYAVPAVVVSKGPKFSKASARSVTGFNIVEFLRSLGDHFEDIGGHAGAAGFTILTEKIDEFLLALKARQESLQFPDRISEIDAEIRFEDLNLELFNQVEKLAPFGLGNPEPIFILKNVKVVESRTVGSQNQHLKLKISGTQNSLRPETLRTRAKLKTQNWNIDCIGFNLSEKKDFCDPGALVDLVFYLSSDSFTGSDRLVLKIKDLCESS